MRTRPGPVVLWLVATVAAIAVASVAISQVGRQIALETPIDEQLAQAADSIHVGTTHEDEGAAATNARDAAPVEPTRDQADQVGGSSSDPGQTPTAQIVRTYDTIGGSAAIAISGDTIEVRWATPRQGFRASVESSASGDELRVDFRSDVHRSRIKVELADGEIMDEIEEDDR